jgi:hypothetical protein
LRSNPLAEHNSGVALSSKDIPQNGGTGNMYQGQAGRAFVQGGGGMSQFYSFNPGVADSDSAHARGSYAPVTVGINSVATGGGGGGSTRRKKNSKKSSAASRRRSTYRRNRRVTKCKKCKCDIIISGGGVRRHTRLCKHKCCKRTKTYGRRTFRQQGGGNGSFANAAYSIGGAQTEVTPSTTALANPAPYTAYNSCHPVV